MVAAHMARRPDEDWKRLYSQQNSNPKLKTMIWDLHCHLGGFAGTTPEERMASLIGFADRLGIDRVCVFMGYPFLEDPTPEQIREQNDQVLQASAKWSHRAFGFLYLSPPPPP